MRFLFATATYRQLYPQTAACREAVIYLRERLAPHEMVEIGIFDGYGAPRNIDLIVETAKLVDADVIVYHDWDMRFELLDVAAMLALAEEASKVTEQYLVGAIYRSSGKPEVLVGRPLRPEPGKPAPRRLVLPPLPKGDQNRQITAAEADHIGFGLVVIPRAVYMNSPRPFVMDGWHPEEKDWITPDTAVSQRVRAAGGACWLTRAHGTVKHRVEQFMGV